jgi:hypothetical protein
MRGQDDHLYTPGDQVFNVGSLLGGVTLAEENLNFHAQLVKSILEASLILDPARFLPGWQYDAYQATFYFNWFLWGWFLWGRFFRGWFLRSSWFFGSCRSTGCQD